MFKMGRSMNRSSQYKFSKNLIASTVSTKSTENSHMTKRWVLSLKLSNSPTLRALPANQVKPI